MVLYAQRRESGQEQQQPAEHQRIDAVPAEQNAHQDTSHAGGKNLRDHDEEIEDPHVDTHLLHRHRL